MAYYRVEYPKFQAFTDAAAYAAGCLVYTYQAGTSNLATTYSERTLTTPNANPIVLNARAEADIFTGQAIKIILKTAAGVTIFTQDYIGETQTTAMYVGATVSTTGNVATVTGSPVATALTDDMVLIYTPDADNVATMGATAYSVTAFNDCVFNGPYTGSTSSVFRVEIDGAASSPDTFKWRKDSEAYTTGVSITGGDQTLKEGIEVNFAVLEGHTNGDYWTLAVEPPYKLNLDGLGTKIVRKNAGGSFIPLESGDIKTGYPVILIYSSVQTCWILTNTADFTAAAETATNRVRYEKVADYNLADSDHGNEISFNSASNLTLTLGAAANFADKFTYVFNAGTGTVTLDADGTEVIYSRNSPAGAGTYVMQGNCADVLQISTNGIDWHVMTGSLPKVTVQSFTTLGAGNSYTHTPGAKYGVSITRAGGGGGGAGTAGGGSGGGGGGVAIEVWAVASLTEPVTVTVGAGGTAGVAGGAEGGTGGTSSFGAYSSATGGAGGTTLAGGAGGTGTGGTVNITGQNGETATPGYGGASYGYDGGAKVSLAIGNNYGGGGGGGANGANPGYAGAQGKVDVIEFSDEFRYIAEMLVKISNYPIY